MIPLYMKIADDIDNDIISGKYSAGSRLKSERDFALDLNVARGTIKKAYAELCKRGHITMVRGSGVYVSKNLLIKDTHSIASGLYKTVIQLQRLDLSKNEIDAMVREAFWQRLKEHEKIHITWVDCSREIINLVSNQIAHYCNVSTSAYTISEIIENPSLIDLTSTDMLVTTIMHFDELCGSVCPSEKLFSINREMISLSLTNKTIRGIAKIKSHHRTAVLFQTEPYRLSIELFLQDFGVHSNCDYIPLESGIKALIEGIKNYNSVILPQSFEAYSGIFAALKERCFACGVDVIDFEYIADAGSLLRLKEKAQRLWLLNNATSPI